jgi:hypothetical protein
MISSYITSNKGGFKMGYPTKIQLIKRKNSEQWYVNFPAAIAKAMEFNPSETVEWIIEDKSQLVLRRVVTPPSALKKKH